MKQIMFKQEATAGNFATMVMPNRKEHALATQHVPLIHDPHQGITAFSRKGCATNVEGA